MAVSCSAFFFDVGEGGSSWTAAMPSQAVGGNEAHVMVQKNNDHYDLCKVTKV